MAAELNVATRAQEFPAPAGAGPTGSARHRGLGMFRGPGPVIRQPSAASEPADGSKMCDGTFSLSGDKSTACGPTSVRRGWRGWCCWTNVHVRVTVKPAASGTVSTSVYELPGLLGCVRDGGERAQAVLTSLSRGRPLAGCRLCAIELATRPAVSLSHQSTRTQSLSHRRAGRFRAAGCGAR